jgi:hypothetical protein
LLFLLPAGDRSGGGAVVRGSWSCSWDGEGCPVDGFYVVCRAELAGGGGCWSVAGCCGQVCSLTRRGKPMGRLREEDDRDRGAAGPSMRTAGSGGRWWRRLCCWLREGRLKWGSAAGEEAE